ncbi:hypothetical protein [Nocardioides bruguierae]|uniref:Uncharacterized protein n=1 Tax=Nocardioides bruguierae TaxID=2945102 RepID=A0A9X2IHK6_9ACTN|nr:hypothetical protein [Nocardioides bruguierae]MCM0622704.1 hypothetical protein [Nocardioides bruguierae]
MVLSTDFYALVAQIIPVLLLTGIIEMRAVSQRWAEPTLPTWVVLGFLVGMLLIILGEVSALWVVSNGAENALVLFGALFGIGVAGSFAALPLVDTVLDWAAPAEKRASWLQRLGTAAALTPFAAAMVALIAASAA